MPQSCKHQRNIQYFFCIVRNVGITNVLETLWYSFEAITLSPTQTLLLLQKACQCDWGDPQSIPQLQRCEQSRIASRPTKNLVPWPRRTPPTPESLLELLPEPHSAWRATTWQLPLESRRRTKHQSLTCDQVCLSVTCTCEHGVCYGQTVICPENITENRRFLPVLLLQVSLSMPMWTLVAQRRFQVGHSDTLRRLGTLKCHWVNKGKRQPGPVYWPKDRRK